MNDNDSDKNDAAAIATTNQILFFETHIGVWKLGTYGNQLAIKHIVVYMRLNNIIFDDFLFK